MVAVFVDTAVLAYAVGDEHPMRQASRRLVELAVSGSVQVHASCEMVQEFLFHRMRRTDRAIAVQQSRDAADLCFLHPFDAKVVHRMIELVEASGIGGRDAVHAATALVNGFDTIVSPDPDFDRVPGLRRLQPQDVVGA